jgi:hypothetical protein
MTNTITKTVTFHFGGPGNLAGFQALASGLEITQGATCFAVVMYVVFPFGVLCGVYAMYFLYRVAYRPAIVVDTHADVKWWRSVVAIHSYLGAFIPCHYRCALSHTLMGATHVSFISLMLLVFYLNVKPKSPAYEYGLLVLACLISHAIRPPLNSGYFWWKWKQDSMEESKKAALKHTTTRAKMHYFKAGDADVSFHGKKALDVLDEVEFDSSPAGPRSGKAYRVESDETVAFGPSSDNPDYGDYRGKNFSPDSYSAHGDGESWENVNSDELAFVGLFRPEGASPVPAYARGGTRGANKGLSSYSSQHGEEYDLNNFSDVGSEGTRSLAPEDYEGVYADEMKSQQEEKDLFLFGHLAADPFEDVEVEPNRAARASVKKPAVPRRPVEQPTAPKQQKMAQSGSSSMRNIWDSSTLRGSAVVPRDNDFDYRKVRQVRAEQTDDLWHRSYLDFGGTGGEDEGGRTMMSEDSSGDGESIRTMATAGDSLLEDEAGLPVSIDTRFFPTFVANMVIFLLIIIGCFILSTKLTKEGVCDTFPKSLGIAIAIDVLVIETAFLGLVVLFRYLNSEDEENTMYSELHPYEGEQREYLGLGDPDRALKQ